MRRHREDIFYPTCTVSTAPDPRVDIFSVTLSGAIAESKGLELTEHAPVRFARALAISPSRPLDCARGDSLCCLVERRGVNPEVETPRPIGALTFTSHTRSSQTAKDETKVQSFARRGCGLPAQAPIRPERIPDYARGDSKPSQESLQSNTRNATRNARRKRDVRNN